MGLSPQGRRLRAAASEVALARIALRSAWVFEARGRLLNSRRASESPSGRSPSFEPRSEAANLRLRSRRSCTPLEKNRWLPASPHWLATNGTVSSRRTNGHSRMTIVSVVNRRSSNQSKDRIQPTMLAIPRIRIQLAYTFLPPKLGQQRSGRRRRKERRSGMPGLRRLPLRAPPRARPRRSLVAR